MIIKPKGVAVNIVGIASTVADLGGVGATLLSVVNTQTSPVLIELEPDGTSVYIAAGERAMLQKAATTTITVDSGDPVYATNVGFTN